MSHGHTSRFNSSDYEGNAVLRMARLPLVSSTLQSVTSVYSGVKGRFPLLGMVGDVAEVGLRAASLAALSQATPLLQSLDTQIEAANDYACFGLDQLEKNFPVLHQSSSEVIGHLKDAFFLTVDDVQVRALEQMEGLNQLVWFQLRALQDSAMGRAAYSGLDEILTQLEGATSYYLPLPPTMRLEWEQRVREYEEQDEGEEPGLWTRFRGLLLSLSLQLYHRMLKQRDALYQVFQSLLDGANRVGLGRVVDMMGFLLRQLQLFLTALLFQAEALRSLALTQVKGQTAMLAELNVVGQLRGLPYKAQEVLVDLQELTMMLLQLLINSTPLYAMLQQPSDQDVEDFLSQERFTTQVAPHRDSTNSLFLKAMDGRPRRRKSLCSRARQGSASPQGTGVAPPDLANGGCPEPQECPPVTSQRRPSATELLLSPVVQFVSQSQKAFEYLSPTSPVDQDDACPLVQEAEEAEEAKMAEKVKVEEEAAELEEETEAAEVEKEAEVVKVEVEAKEVEEEAAEVEEEAAGEVEEEAAGEVEEEAAEVEEEAEEAKMGEEAQLAKMAEEAEVVKVEEAELEEETEAAEVENEAEGVKVEAAEVEEEAVEGEEEEEAEAEEVEEVEEEEAEEAQVSED